MVDTPILLTLLGLGIVPPVLFLLWVRNREVTEREPFPALFLAFGYGATVGVVVAFLLNTAFGFTAQAFWGDAAVADFATVVISAPVFEEAVKAAGLALVAVRKQINEFEDGIVYGAAVGLGFAMTENLYYGFTSLAEGAELALIVMVIRVFSATILHAGASALFGFGVSDTIMRHRSWWRVVPYYFIAVALHAAYNGIVTIVPLVGFLLAVGLVWAVWVIMQRHVKNLEAEVADARTRPPPP